MGRDFMVSGSLPSSGPRGLVTRCLVHWVSTDALGWNGALGTGDKPPRYAVQVCHPDFEAIPRDAARA